MSAKYTPGPWEASVVPGVEFNIYGVGKLQDQVERVANFEMVNTSVTDPEMEANARVIAAAPEMLEALECLLGHEEHNGMMYSERIKKAQGAIAKAKGGAA